jgi:hypothetical protein
MTRLVALISSAALAILVFLAAAPARAQMAWYEGFEGPETSWREAGGNVPHKLPAHQRVEADAHTGNGCEWLRLEANTGSAIYFAHDIGRPRVIDDLLPTVWVKADRPGVQFLARVALPRTTDPRTGRPATVLVEGSHYSDAGRWQQLRISDVPTLLARQVRVLRAQLGPNVDGREAYLEAALLNVFCGPGVTNVWIDDLDAAGYVGRTAVDPEPHGGPPNNGGWRGPGREAAHTIRLAGAALLVDGQPLFPRLVQHQGEPLELLKQLGFNGVWTSARPSPELLAEAARLGLWLVCPPPVPERPEQDLQTLAASAAIGPEFAPVLAWDLGSGLTRQELESTASRAERVRAADRAVGRPLVCSAEGGLREYSRRVDLLLLDRRPLGTSLELRDYATWLRSQPRLARPRTPVWTTVQTQPSPEVRGQLALIDASRPPPTTVASEQIRLLAYLSVACGSRGLLFLSDSPLSAQDADTQHRALALQQVNRELEVLEPWAAAGDYMTDAEGGAPEVRASVLRTDHSRLALPMWIGPAAQFVPDQSAANGLSIIVPGAPESLSAFQVLPGGLPPLDSKRIAGGIRLKWDEFDLAGAAVLAQDPLVLSSLSRRCRAAGPSGAELQRRLAVQKLRVDEEVIAGLRGLRIGSGDPQAWLADARQSLAACDARLAAGNYPDAYRQACRAMRAMRLLERTCWNAAVEGLGSPTASPGATAFATLPWHLRLVDRLKASRPAANSLPGGDLEDLGTMVQAGWRHFQLPSEGLKTSAELCATAARSGRTGLRLSVRAENPEQAPALVETPPIWITTGGVPVEAGQLVRIQGWVQIPAPIIGSVDGLMIVDSLGGPALAERIGQTAGWRQFVLYRVAPRSGRVSVTLALAGMGEAWIDDLAVEVLQSSGTAGLARRPPVGTAAGW